MLPRGRFHFAQRASSCAAVVAALLSASPAYADRAPSPGEVKLAKEMLREAIEEKRAGNFDDAVSILEQVIAIRPTAEAELTLGDCLVRLGRLVDARRTWEQGQDRARLQKERALEKALTGRIAKLSPRIPAISVRLPAEVDGVKVTIDGESVDRSRLARPIPLDPGEHALEAQAEGQQPFVEVFTLAEGETPVVQVVFPVASAGVVAPLRPEAPTEEKRAESGGIPMGTWIAGSVAVVLLAGGTVAFVAAGSAAADGEARCARQVACDPGDIDAVRTLDGAALGMWIGAGAAAGLAFTLLALDEPSSAASDGASSARRATPARTTRLRVGPTGLSIQGSF